MNKTHLWLWLGLRCMDSPPLFSKVLSLHKNLEAVYNMTPEEYKAAGVFSGTMIKKLSDKDLSGAIEAEKKCLEKKIRVIPYTDPLYPPFLKTISDPPALLYAAGKIRDLRGECCVACVGSRDITRYGFNQAYSISHDLSKCGCVIVSGMAKGIDSVCHSAAIDCGGYTVAVLGCGVDRVYPAENSELYENILKNGMVISEYPPGSDPLKYYFPRRNRIISGVSECTLVLEAAEKSGSLITADYAKAQGRLVFTIPYMLGESSGEGCVNLARKGIKTIRNAKDLLDEIGPRYKNKLDASALTSYKRDVKQISPTPGHFSGEGPSDAPYSKDDGDYGRNAVEKKESFGSGEGLSDFPSQKEKLEEEYFKKPERKKKKKSVAPAENETLIEKATDEITEKTPEGLSDEEKTLWEALSRVPKTPDMLLSCGLSIGEILSNLTILEIKGYAESLPGGTYIRRAGKN